ncbi:MAG: flagellar biosynthesis protein FlhA [Phycisphaerales bacterium]|nr:flagellar biosynthesis protein FlhA [Phycisphaerales bacterium]MCI0631625.1 flagellar biosynthesis protein FlhA [Phycisphaerales bacterium]MCI0674309.1 flagellar biosynthesis protein FlhA [Phycisphaerales bacterium]
MSAADGEFNLAQALDRIGRHRHLLVPSSILLLIVVLVVPMPPAVIDVLISGNIALAAVILLTTVYMKRPLDFSAFPAILLATTLFRLVLNVASTRLILSADAATPAEAAYVAGHVIEAFGSFVAGESVIVGAVIFVILIVVQFVVITKGATRMSEVSARFTLDAMPGKQMAIDAELSSGAIDDATARQRRDAVMREADFYGAMDGASKFVRGDAIAGVIITVVNILGGFAIGWLQKGWSIGESVDVFTRLTIGDGLASQVPAFILAIAAGLIVARAGGDQTIGEAIPRQLTAEPRALYFIGGFLFVLAFTGLPTWPMLVTGAGLIGLAWALGSGARSASQAAGETAGELAGKPHQPPPVEDLLRVETLEMEIGMGLLALVDPKRGGDVLDRISMVRRKLATEIGIIVPPIRIRDNVQLRARAYRVKLRGAVISEAEIYPDRLMAMDGGATTGQVKGIAGFDPAFGMPAMWIERERQELARGLGYTVVEPSSVLATHVTELVVSHADELLSRQEVAHLLDQLRADSPKLVDDLVPAVVKIGDLQKVLQCLLRERVPIRDLGLILETMGDWAGQIKNVEEMTEHVRIALRRTISSLHTEVDEGGRSKLFCVTLDPQIEALVSAAMDAGGIGATVGAELGERIAGAVRSSAAALISEGHELVVLASARVRAPVRQILSASVPGAAVLSYSEIVRGLDVRSMGLVQLSERELAESP